MVGDQNQHMGFRRTDPRRRHVGLDHPVVFDITGGKEVHGRIFFAEFLIALLLPKGPLSLLHFLLLRFL
jgi:hypothetical protein